MTILTGAPPFDGDCFADLLLAHLDARPPLLSSRIDAVPAELEAIVQRCLEKEATARFPSMAELADALQVVEANLLAGGLRRSGDLSPFVAPTLRPVASPEAVSGGAPSATSLHAATGNLDDLDDLDAPRPRSRRGVMFAVLALLVVGGGAIWVSRDRAKPGVGQAPAGATPVEPTTSSAAIAQPAAADALPDGGAAAAGPRDADDEVTTPNLDRDGGLIADAPREGADGQETAPPDAATSTSTSRTPPATTKPHPPRHKPLAPRTSDDPTTPPDASTTPDYRND
jgi:serine/threonine-protein kinase